MKFYPEVAIFIALCTPICAYSESNETAFLYAPARSVYMSASTSTTSDCKMCKAIQKNNTTEFVLARTQHFTVLLNLFPYGTGHILIVDNNHGSTFDSLTEKQRNELALLMATVTTRVKAAFKCSGLNIGYNEGIDAGSSIPDHLHIHVLPRFQNHTKSFIQAIANTQVVQWDFVAMQKFLLPFFEDLNTSH